MRIGLIGAGMHWHSYAPALKQIPGAMLAAVAASGPEETTAVFDRAPGLTPDTRRYEDAEQMLAREALDVVQVCCRPDRTAGWSMRCLERDLPVFSEKPIAMDLPSLASLYSAVTRSKAAFAPMHTMRGDATLAAIAHAVRSGAIGEPLNGYSQKSYRWGKSRPDYFRSRATFPGLAPFIGIHAFDWLFWILGDVFTEVYGRESAAARLDYPGCASHAAFTLATRNGGALALSLDYLRPDAAPSHGDERIRLAGTKGVVESVHTEGTVILTTVDRPPHALPLIPQTDVATAFFRAIQGEGPLPIAVRDTFRITEIAILAQQAADTHMPVSLVDSAFAPENHND